MTPKEYLRLKGYTPEAIVCNDWNQTLSAFDIEEILEDYHQSKLKDNEVLDLVSGCDLFDKVNNKFVRENWYMDSEGNLLIDVDPSGVNMEGIRKAKYCNKERYELRYR